MLPILSANAKNFARVPSSKAQAWIRNWLLVISSGERVRTKALRSRAIRMTSTCIFSKTTDTLLYCSRLA